jgi:peptide/nickel transport system substrate-binding protein
VRVRRGLLQAIDRQALVDYLHQGQAPVADTFISPNDVKWDWVKDAVIRYDYDPRQAQELLAEAGWRRGPDGAVVNAAGERVTLQLRTIEGGQWQDEMAITADHWKAIGLNVEQSIVPTAQSRDRMIRSIFPALEAGTRSLPLLSSVRSYYGPECRSEATRWAGNNLSCYQHPVADRLAEPLLLAIDRGEQQRLSQALVRHFTQELPSLPLYFTVQMFLFREGVTGARGGGRPVGSNTWNIHEWDIS